MSKASKLFQAFEQVNVLVVGDVMIDRYLEGKVSRISPEAPVPIVHLQSSDNRLGGAANVALNIKALGATPYLCSVIGTDENAAVFLDLLPKHDLSNIGITASKERCTTVKTRILAANQQMLRVDQENTHPLDEKETDLLLKKIQDILTKKNIHVILFQDYNKGVLTKKIIQELIQKATHHNIISVVDPKKANFLHYKNTTLFKPNLKEVQEGLNIPISGDAASLEKAALYLHQQLEHQYTMITLSERGIFIADGKESNIISTYARKIADVCGAGDTVISVAALGLATGMPILQIAQLANLAGGQVCEKVGVVPVNKVQLQAEYEQVITD